MRRPPNILKLDRDLLTSMRICERLPYVNLQLWDGEAFSIMTSIIGKPMKMDAATSKKTKLNYARLLIEVSAKDELPNEISLTLYNGEVINQEVIYEWFPPRCNVCKCFGHTKERCNIRKE